jgi:hypothetical protein
MLTAQDVWIVRCPLWVDGKAERVAKVYPSFLTSFLASLQCMRPDRVCRSGPMTQLGQRATSSRELLRREKAAAGIPGLMAHSDKVNVLPTAFSNGSRYSFRTRPMRVCVRKKEATLHFLIPQPCILIDQSRTGLDWGSMHAPLQRALCIPRAHALHPPLTG